MFGCYLTADDDQFLDVITDELKKYNSAKQSSFFAFEREPILLFPSLSARHRLILHRLRERKHPDLFSFSVGEERDTRRTIICFKAQLMEEIKTTASSNDTSTLPKVASPAATSNSNEDSSTKRRPDQALYKPPRRSKNLEVSNSTPSTAASLSQNNPVEVSSSTPSTTAPLPENNPLEVSSPTPASASPATAVEESQTNNDTAKAVKTKAARPSMTPYVPPSRRSQPGTKEPVPSATTTTNEKRNEDDGSAKKKDEAQEEEEEDWEKLADGSSNPLDNNLMEEIQSKFKERVQIKKPTNDYSQWSVDDLQVKETDFAHIIEVSNFPSSFRTEDLSNGFKTHTRTNFDIKWVDETHALIVFSDPNTALDVLQMEHPLFKVCSMSQASAASKKKAKSSTEFLQPYKARPQTSSLTANRQICAALGMKNSMSTNKAQTERQKIESARQQKRRDKEEQSLVWDGGVLPAAPST